MFTLIKKSFVCASAVLVALSSASFSYAEIEKVQVSDFQMTNESNLCHPINIDLVFHGDVMTLHSMQYLFDAVSSTRGCKDVAYELQYVKGRHNNLSPDLNIDVAKIYLYETAKWLSEFNLQNSPVLASKTLTYDEGVNEFFVVRFTVSKLNALPSA